MKKIFLFVLLTILLTACGGQSTETGFDMGMGGGNGMMTRHHAEIPAEYIGVTNPIPVDDASLERGAALYATNCAGGTHQPDDGR